MTSDPGEISRFSTFEEYKAFNWTDGCLEMCSSGTDCYKEYFIIESTEYVDHIFNFSKELYHVFIEFPTHPTTII